MIVMPEQDAVIAITSETPNMQEELNLVWQYLLPAMNPERSTLSMNDAIALKKRLGTLKLSLPVVTDTLLGITSLMGLSSVGATYKMQSNAKNIESIAVNSKGDVITLDLKIKGANYPVNFGNGKWIEGKTEMLGPSLVELAKNHFAGLPPSQIAGAYSWKEKNVLEAQLRYIDSPHTLYMTLNFDGDKVSVDMQDSFRPPDKKITIKGEKIN